MPNEDLILMEQQIKEYKSKPSIDFEQVSKKGGVETPKTDDARSIVHDAFGSAVVFQAQNNEEVKQELLDTADVTIHNELNAIKSRAEAEDKRAHFENKKGACECFGYNEETTEKWAVSLMSFWHNIATAIWIVSGFITFAPVIFIGKKLPVMIKSTW